ncbi:MAG: hypothetical protein IJY50_06375 [Clostridia bacterium]|nr:hypothetical protein [Clostridia bacterium]
MDRGCGRAIFAPALSMCAAGWLVERYYSIRAVKGAGLGNAEACAPLIVL